jgi:hypothetical protein
MTTSRDGAWRELELRREGVRREMDVRTSFCVETADRVRVSSADDVDSKDTRIIAYSLHYQLGGIWTLTRDWQVADGEVDAVAIFERKDGTPCERCSCGAIAELDTTLVFLMHRNGSVDIIGCPKCKRRS